MDTLQQRKKTTNPRSNASFLSKAIFWYLNPLFRKGSKTPLEISDLYANLQEYSSKKLKQEVDNLWNKELEKKGRGESASLYKAFVKAYFSTILKQGTLYLLQGIFKLASPFLVGYLIEYFVSKDSGNSDFAFVFAAAIVLSFILSQIFRNAAFFSFECLGVKIRSAVTGLIYQKVWDLSATALSQSVFSETSSGYVVKLISSDCQNLMAGLYSINFLWVAALELILAAVLIYLLIGVSVFPGIGLILVMLPCQLWIGRCSALSRRKARERTDERVKVMGEVIKGMHAIKMYSWEEPFTNIINGIRRKEMSGIKRASILRAVNTAAFVIMPYLCAMLMFTTHYLLDGVLTAKKVFATIGLLQLLRHSVSLFLPLAFQNISEALTACKRIQKFLMLDEMNSENVASKPLSPEDPKPYIIVKNIKASWSNSENDVTLHGIHFELTREKSLLMIAGPVGSGKSSILMAVCKELPICEGSIWVNGTIAYASQQPWIFHGTIQQNILFGQIYDQERYQKVINACALIEDLRQFPESDKTVIGERGLCLNGGQKARISLARAVYRNADIYLFDGPFSDVDVKAGRHIFEHCINGLLKDKIRVVCTHQAQYLRYADLVLGIQEGKQITLASYDELTEMGFDVQSLVCEDSLEKEWDRDSAIDFEEFRMSVRRHRPRTKSSASSQSHQSNTQMKAGHVNPSYISEESVSAAKELQNFADIEETKLVEDIPVRLYVQYLKAGGGVICTAVVIFLCVASQISCTGVDWWIGVWSDAEQGMSKNETAKDFRYYFDDKPKNNLFLYVGVTLLTAVLALVSSILFFLVLVNSSRNLHNKMLSAFMDTSLYFSDVTPLGRILNRFSKDIYFLDEEMPWIFYGVILNGLFCFNAVVICAVSVPYTAIIIIPVLIAFFLLRTYYLRTAKDVKQLEAFSRSPFFTHLSATLEGLTTIRALNAVDKVTEEAYDCQDLQSDGSYMSLSIERWFSIRIDVILSFFVAVCVFAPIILLQFTTVNATFVGLSLVYCLQLGGFFQWCVKESIQVENMMTSTERIVEYCNLEPEQEEISSPVLPKGWPKYGIITAEGASFAHHKSLPYVLKTMFFCIRASEKIGVIGRAGAGKSSLISALFRTGKLMGTIRIDGVATSELPLKTLRSSMSVIPQDPILFSGSLRLNIDPLNEFEDPDIWEVLEEVQLKDAIFDLPNKLNTDVMEGRSNFTVGQRQLLCLARALLLRKKILFIDEANASVDNETDSLIQETIKDKFRDCTVVTIAQRLNTIMDCDRIMVIKGGKIVQFDEPCELFKDKNGEFKQIVEQSGHVEAARLEMMAKEAKEIRQLIKERTQQMYPGCNITRSKTKEEIMEMFGSRVVYETSL